LRCADDSFYVGSTSYADVLTRVDEHNDAKYIGYTAARRPIVLVWSRHFDDLRDAHEVERRLKGWSRAKKLALIQDKGVSLETLASRRAGKPLKPVVQLTKRQLANLAQSVGTRNLAAKPVAVRAVHSAKRTGGTDIKAVKLARSRHPEVRATRAPKDR
jgi:putative endonuclease